MAEQRATVSDLEDLARRVAALERAQLEQALAGTSDDALRATVTAPDDDRFWALHGVRERLPAPGGVVFAGTVDLPGGEHLEWQWGESTTTLLDSSWESVTDRLGALAHPVRLELLRHVLRGVCSTADLTALEVMGTSGQLYHHLNQLLAAGWLRQNGRGRYQVPAERVVPVLVLLTAARA